MNYDFVPEDFRRRVLKIRTGIFDTKITAEKLSQIQKEFSGSEIDVAYKNLQPITLLVFESEIDLLAYRLKYGDNYV